MPADSISHGYARSFLAQAQAEDAVSAVAQELHQLRELLKANPDLLKFLKDPNIQREGKRRALAELFAGRVHALVLNALLTLSDNDRAGLTVRVIEEFLAQSAAARDQATGEVVTATPLDAATKEKLEAALATLTGKNVQLMQKVDPTVLGGAVIRVGEEVIDGSLRRKLAQIKERLMQ